MTEKPVNLDTMLCFAIHSAAHAIQRANKPLLDKLGLTYPQYLVMLVLWQVDGLLVKAIGEKLYLDSGTLTPLLKRLEASGFILRERDPDDERQVRITLTREGRALKLRAQEIPRQVLCASGQSEQAVASLRAQLALVRNSLVGNNE